MKNFIIVLLIILLVGAGYYIYTAYTAPVLPQEQVVNVPDNNTPEAPEWNVYTNQDYDFQISYPSGWQVASETAAGEPRISIYRTGNPPYSHHVNATQVSIFPKGLGTEGAAGENRPAVDDLTSAIERNPREFFLTTGSPYAYFMGFQTHPATWEDYGYVWASVFVENKETKSDCPGLGGTCDPFSTAKVTGTINPDEFETVKEILKTFKFN
jgi:hypothetical protein